MGGNDHRMDYFVRPSSLLGRFRNGSYGVFQLSKTTAPEVIATEPVTDEPAPSTKSNLSLQERFDVIDWLRTRLEPVFCDTWVAAAKLVTEETKVEVSPSQIAYIIRELPKLALDTKLVIGTATSDSARIAAMSTQLADARSEHERHESLIANHEQRIAHLESLIADAEAKTD